MKVPICHIVFVSVGVLLLLSCGKQESAGELTANANSALQSLDLADCFETAHLGAVGAAEESSLDSIEESALTECRSAIAAAYEFDGDDSGLSSLEEAALKQGVNDRIAATKACCSAEGLDEITCRENSKTQRNLMNEVAQKECVDAYGEGKQSTCVDQLIDDRGKQRLADRCVNDATNCAPPGLDALTTICQERRKIRRDFLSEYLGSSGIIPSTFPATSLDEAAVRYSSDLKDRRARWDAKHSQYETSAENGLKNRLETAQGSSD